MWNSKWPLYTKTPSFNMVHHNSVSSHGNVQLWNSLKSIHSIWAFFNLILLLYFFTATSAQLNMRGVFLHVLGDALGSVVVIVSALIIMFVEDSWRFYVDPALSLVIVFIITSTTIPLCKYKVVVVLCMCCFMINI